MDSVLSNCPGGSGEVMVGDVITVETNANPSVSEFQWIVNGEEFSTSVSLTVVDDMVGETEVSCTIENVMIGDERGTDTVTCAYTVLRTI